MSRRPDRALSLVFLVVFSSSSAAQVVRRFDMGTATSPGTPGFTSVAPTVLYSPGLGYGYVVPPTRNFYRSAPIPAVPTNLPETLIRDGHQRGTDMTFRIDLANGTYLCVAFLGDLGEPNGVPAIITPLERLDILANGVAVVEDAFARTLTRKASFDEQIGGYKRVTFRAVVSSGSLVLTFHSDNTPTSSNTLTGLEVYPDLPAPIAFDHTTASLVADPAYATLAGPALAAFNAADYGAAKVAFDAVPDPLLRAWGHSWILGWMTGSEADLDSDLLDDTIATLQSLNAPDDPRVAVLLAQARDLERGHFFDQARGYTAAALPGSLSDIIQNLSAGVLFFEQFDDDVLRAAQPHRPECPFFPKARFLTARNLYTRGTHIFDPNTPYNQYWLSALANEFAPHQSSFPKAHDLAVFTFMATQYGIPGGLVGNWPGPSSLPSFDPATAWWAQNTEIASHPSAPPWANAQRRYHRAYRNLGDWWMENRNLSGELGGGDGDDVEGGALLALPTIAVSKLGGFLETNSGEVLDKVLFGPSVDVDQGYFANCGDVEHAAEFTTNPLFVLFPSSYGSPRYVEYALRTSRNMDQLVDTAPWTQPTGTGTRRFVGYNFGAASTCGASRDIPLNLRAIVPTLSLADYNDLPRARALLDELARWWATHATSTAQGKPAGIFPASVASFGAPVFGTSGWWTNGGYYDLPNGADYHSYVYALLLGAWSASSAPDRHVLLRPIADAGLLLAALRAGQLPGGGTGSAAWAATTLRSQIGNAVATARAALISEASQLGLTAQQLTTLDTVIAFEAAPYLSYAALPAVGTKDKTLIQNTFTNATTWMRYFWVLASSGVSYTDRIYGFTSNSHQLLYSTLMGGAFGIVPETTISWSDPETGTPLVDFAALVNDLGTDSLDILYFGFDPAPRDVVLRVWRHLDLGVYELRIGNDSNFDDAMDGAPHTVATVSLSSKGANVPLPQMPVGTLQKIELRKLAPLPAGPTLKSDPAISSVVLGASGTLDVTVHNLGAAPVIGSVIELREGGTLVGSQPVPTILAPDDLSPKSTIVGVAYTPIAPNAPVTASVVSAAGTPQVTSLNDAVTIFPNVPPPTLTLGPVLGYASFDVLVDAAYDVGKICVFGVGISGDSPGIALSPFVTIPINYDFVTVLALRAGNGIFTGAVGTVDAAGHATMAVTIPPVPGISGITVWFAAAVFDSQLVARAATNSASFVLP